MQNALQALNSPISRFQVHVVLIYVLGAKQEDNFQMSWVPRSFMHEAKATEPHKLSVLLRTISNSQSRLLAAPLCLTLLASIGLSLKFHLFAGTQ
jgi:hypothetical protein